MKRKVVQQGPATLMVSLPSKWAKKYSITRGDELNIIEDHHKLIIELEGQQIAGKYETEVDVSNMENYIINLFLAVSHKKGLDKIKLNYNNSEKIKPIKQRLKSLLGYEIIEQTPKHCVIKNIAGDTEKEYDNLLRRSFLVTKNMFQNILEFIEKDDFSEHQTITDLEITNNRLTNYCERMLVKKLHRGVNSFVSYVIVWNIESIADDLRDLVKFVVENKHKLNKNYIIDYKKVSSLFEKYYDLFYNFSVKKINKLKADVVELKDMLIKKASKDSSYFFINLIVSRTYDMLASTLSLNLEKCM